MDSFTQGLDDLESFAEDIIFTTLFFFISRKVHCVEIDSIPHLKKPRPSEAIVS